MTSQLSGPTANGTPIGTFKSPAALLEEQHTRSDPHQVTVEDVPDEYDLQHPLPSASAAAGTCPGDTAKPASDVPATSAPAKEKPSSEMPASSTVKPPPPKVPVFDVRSEELFPALGGAPKPRTPAAPPIAWGARKSAGRNPSPANGLSNLGQPPSHISSSNTSSRTSTPTSGLATPGSMSMSAVQPGSISGPKIMTLPGKHVERIRFAPSQMLPRGQLKKPIRDILRDTSKRSRAIVDMHNGPGESIIFEGKGSVEAVRQALKEVAQQVGSKQRVSVPIPASARPHIIGRQGAVVQGIHDRTGARINVPKPQGSLFSDEDDDSVTIDVEIEGDAVAAEMARREIEAIVKERSSNINLRLKNIPPEFFPFIAGAHNAYLTELEERTKTQIRVPRYDTWSRPPPPEAAAGQVKFSPDPDRHIQISGERSAAQQARAEIEQRAEELQGQITLRQLAINRGQHQFILGDLNNSLHEFLAQTGCSIILPPANDDTEFLTITGPPDQIEFGVNRAMDLATSMQMASIDVSRQHPAAPSGPHVHARALTSYLQQRQAIKELERLYDAHIVIPSSLDGPVTWEVYSRDGKNTIRARSDIVNLIQAHPPSKLASLLIDPYFHSYLRSRIGPELKNSFGVHLILPDDPDTSNVVLVYEGQDWVAGVHELPRRRPSISELALFENALAEAKSHLFTSLGDQNDVLAKSIMVPLKYHDKLRRFVGREQQKEGEDHIPICVSATGDEILLRGRTSDVEDLALKIKAFVLEQEKDDLERGYITSFAFPQKYANFLIGRRGENINKLREEFDVDIKVENGKVDVKGPKAKADVCRSRIIALAKRLEDEATYILKIPQHYHRDLIGQKGSQVNRLQERYNVRIQFPRAYSISGPEDQSVTDTASEIGGNRNPRPSQAPDEVIVRGPRKGADGAREEILSLYQWVVDHSQTDLVSVAQSQIPSLIGQKGREMDQLRAETGAQIDVPAANNAPDAAGRVDIKLKGTNKQVADAKKLLLQRAQEFDSIVVKTIEVDKKHHRALIGGGGATIRKIVSDAGGPNDGSASRIVKFPPPDSDETVIRLEGNAAIVERIVAAIEEFVREKDDQIVTAIDVPLTLHRFLIGRGGETRRNLESQFKITLDVPKQGSGRMDIKIKGPSGAVEKAKAHIQSLIREQHAESVQVPRNLHHSVADNGRLFHDSSTISGTHSWKIVDVATVESTDATSANTIPWVLSGTPENVAKAKAIIEMALQTASRHSATGYLILPDPKTYRLVIGPGGDKINEIRKQTSCRINVPKHQTQGEAIEIKGPKDNLEAAKDMILEAVAVGTRGNGASH
ncbi:hypothetical protein PAAG_09085 [Paracoccidioides lutzii Pb01]|uniref:K Homology domain-containing protein n=1 Tax=Paracoccidioides lutzii (strain ATCC MYA-826 / Pb01) TaxID=502779 RepID=C1HE93_PARBA|nr:hypothetical protein PAAG_09085 [Paracoccidioides lutzii Pb01]EEH41007.2 hypothetical protein PAAG_09085 [Paracoccidioides lutzii Pb01]